MCRGFPYETSTTRKKGGKIYVKRRILRSITLSRYTYLAIIGLLTGHNPALLAGRSAPWAGHGLENRRGQRATMQLGQLLELGKGETFFARILRMQTAGQLGGLEPEAQGFGIHR